MKSAHLNKPKIVHARVTKCCVSMKIDNGDRQDPIRFGFFRTSNNAEINPRISRLDLESRV